jgi:TolA-binding protein
MILALRAEVGGLQIAIPELEHRIQELQEQMKLQEQTSRNSINSQAKASLAPPTAKRQLPQSDSGEVTIPNTELSPRDRLRELLTAAQRRLSFLSV